MEKELKPLILIHGLLRTKYSMWYLGQALRKFGYKPYLFGYKSLKGTIDSHAKELREYIIQNKLTQGPLYFVTHSLGGIILRQFSAKHASDLQLFRAVNLGPPHKGSITAKALSKFRIIRLFLGPSFMELTSINIPGPCGNLEIGVIAGRVNLRRGLYGVLKEENDGVVTVNETIIVGIKEHIIVTGTHSLLMYKTSVTKLTAQFLDTGKFS